MTYMTTHVFLGLKPIDQPLFYVTSSRNASKGTETMAQDASVILEAINIEVNSKCFKFLSMCLTKLNVASC